MSTAVSSVVRPFWMPGLNDVAGKQENGLGEWFIHQDYVVMSPFQDKNNYTLDLTNSKTLVSAFAYDCNRMASAAFETMHMITRLPSLSKSYAWLVIKSYYAAFFAAHAIVRILGKSCSQLDNPQIRSVNQAAKLYGTDNGIQIVSGYYCCTYLSEVASQLHCGNLKASGGGSHEEFWKFFTDELRVLGDKILSSSQTVSTQSQPVVVQLDELRRNLCLNGCNGGNWLSMVRNKVNYRHELDAWFPYSKKKKDFVDELYEISYAWLDNPMNISLDRQPGIDLSAFLRTCSFLVGLCRVLIEDMAGRCSTGKSYLTYGSMRLLNTMQAQAA